MNEDYEHVTQLVELGRGSFAKVVCVIGLNNQLIALKSYDKLVNQSRSHRIISEKNALERIGRCNFIVELYNSFNNDTVVGLAMEPILGGDLSKYLQRFEKLCLPSAIKLCVEIIGALIHLFNCKCIHRDIKASNCLIDSYGRVKLGDFGSAQLMDNESRTFTVIGTPHAMSPEMLSRTIGYSYQSDWWSLGILVFEMVIGKPPFVRNKDCLLAMDTNPLNEITNLPHLHGEWSITKRIQKASDIEREIFAQEFGVDLLDLIQKLLIFCPEGRWWCGMEPVSQLFELSMWRECGVCWEAVREGVEYMPEHRLNTCLHMGHEERIQKALDKLRGTIIMEENALTDEEQQLFADF